MSIEKLIPLAVYIRNIILLLGTMSDQIVAYVGRHFDSSIGNWSCSCYWDVGDNYYYPCSFTESLLAG